MRPLLLFIPLVLLAAPAGSGSRFAASFYAIQQIDPPDGYDGANVVAVNDRSQVLCEARYLTRSAAFLWGQGKVTLIDSPTGGSVHPYALDDSGRVAGSDVSPAGSITPFIWKEGLLTWLPTPPGFAGAEPRALSNDGTVAGEAIDSGGNPYACVWHNGLVSLLPTLSGRPYSQVRAMNDRGQIVGTSFAVFDPAGKEHAGQGRAVLWLGGQPRDLGTLPGYSYSAAYAINNLGTIAGVSYEPPTFHQGFILTAARFQPIRGDFTPRALNDAGRVIGREEQYAVEVRDDFTERLTWHLPNGSRVPLSDAASVNEPSQIAASAEIDGRSRAYLLTPTLADLKTEVTVSLQTAPLSETFTATIQLTNQGQGEAYSPQVSFYSIEGVRVVSAASPGWRVSQGPNWAGATASRMQPGESRTLTLELRCTLAGTVHIRASSWCENDCDASNNGSSETIFVPGTPMPDLFGSLSYARYYRSGGTREWPEIRAYAELHTFNWGTADARDFSVRLYLVEQDGAFQRRLLLRSHRVGRLPRGERREGYWDGRMRVKNITNLHLEAEWDAGNRVREADENNNTYRVFLREEH